MSAQEQISKHLAEIEKIKQHQFRQDLIDVLSDKRSTEEMVAVSAKAFYDNYVRKIRQANVAKAQEAKRQQKENPVPAQ